MWSKPDRAQELGRERTKLEAVVGTLDRLKTGLTEAAELLELAESDADEGMVAAVEHDVAGIEREVAKLEFQRMFPGEMDSHNAFVDIQAGAGGTEAQDWAQMLLRMYLKWADAARPRRPRSSIHQRRRSRRHEELRRSEIKGEFAYGWLRTETGVHRLVRKSPFDSGNARRHTSFASVFVSPEVDDDIKIDLNPADHQDGCLSFERRGRPAREQDRVGGAPDATGPRASSLRARTNAASTRTARRR